MIASSIGVRRQNRRDTDMQAKSSKCFPEEMTTEVRSEGEEELGRKRCGWGSRYSSSAGEAAGQM